MSSVSILFDESQIRHRVEELSSDIAKSISGDFTVVGVLKGSFVFVADLVRALGSQGLTPQVDFMRLRSYGSAQESSGQVQLIGEVPGGLERRTVLLIDDITDTGLSLLYARNLLLESGALAVRSCTLMDKPSRRTVDLEPDFVGFTIDDVFVVGYGIDYAEEYRYLPYIGTIE